MIDQYDQQETYCRRLGHHVKFHYCRTEHNGKPCPLIFDCWFERMDIGAFMREHYQPEEVAYLTRPSQGRVASLLDLIKQAQERQK